MQLVGKAEQLPHPSMTEIVRFEISRCMDIAYETVHSAQVISREEEKEEEKEEEETKEQKSP